MKNTEPENIGKHLYAVRNYVYIYIYIYIYTSPFVGHFLVIEVCHVSFVLSFVCPISSALFLFVVVFFSGLDRGLRPKMVPL